KLFVRPCPWSYPSIRSQSGDRSVGLGKHRLSAKSIEYARLKDSKTERFLEDGSGLRLRLRPGAGGRVLKAWILRIGVNGARREFGLGSYPEISLQDARSKAEEL